MRYFAYGSNMDQKRMRDRGVEFTSRERAILKGWRLVFNKVANRNPKEGYANIVEDKDGVVEGILYEISEEGMGRLDDCEGHPDHYYREKVTVILDNGEEVKAITYIAQPKMERGGLKPTREYLNHLLAGCDLLSGGYCEMLKKWKTLD